MDSSDLQQFLAEYGFQLDRTARLFSLHSNEDYALQQVPACFAEVARHATRFKLEQTAELATAAKQLVERVISRQAALTFELRVILLDVFDQIRDFFVDVQATGREQRASRHDLLSRVQRVWGQLDQLVLTFPTDDASDEQSSAADSDNKDGDTENCDAATLNTANFDVKELRDSWTQIAERSDAFSLRILEGIADSTVRQVLLCATVDEDLQRQLIQVFAIAVRFADSPESAKSFVQLVAQRVGLSALAGSQLDLARAIVLEAVSSFLGDNNEAIQVWQEFLSVAESWVRDTLPELRKAS